MEVSFSDLEGYLLGELEPERARRLEEAVAKDASLKAWIDERRAEMRAFPFDARKRPFADLRREAGAPRERAPVWRGILGALIAVSAAGVAALVLVPRGPSESSYAVRMKGGPQLQIAVRSDEGSTVFEAGSSLHPGDRLRFTVLDPRGGFVVVLLQDSGGKVDVLYEPKELGRFTAGAHVLPGSVELDDKTGRERLYVMVADEAPDVGAWVEELERSFAARGLDHAWLPPGSARVSTVEYEKVEAK